MFLRCGNERHCCFWMNGVSIMRLSCVGLNDMISHFSKRLPDVKLFARNNLPADVSMPATRFGAGRRARAAVVLVWDIVHS